ncbi:hypothetical protein [Dyadobacter psychrotolerans]|uniref:DUF4386 family protein n=1 Tax=Dyadobacter psychrotolerans TaxID=2541721 RepID=A0A4R5DII5_9BACT|nr:hypothetical protein [Dyadobacter psychrotolerans]TDE11751.1 hypothetical protein E0F88_25355 [Dyadobacter psychrotolerans]
MKRILPLFLFGLVLTIMVFYNLVLWWVICSDTSLSLDQAKQAYLYRYPGFVADALLLTLLDIVMSAAAGLCFFRNRQILSGTWGLLAKGFAVVHLILICWLVFSLM